MNDVTNIQSFFLIIIFQKNIFEQKCLISLSWLEPSDDILIPYLIIILRTVKKGNTLLKAIIYNAL